MLITHTLLSDILQKQEKVSKILSKQFDITIRRKDF